MSFVIFYVGRFIKAFDTLREAEEWANNKWEHEKERIGHYEHCVIKEL